MKKIIKMSLIILGCVLFLGAFGKGSVATWAVDQDDVEEAQGQVEAIQEKVNELENTLQELSESMTDTEEYVEELDGMLNNLSSELVAYRNQIYAKQAEIDSKNQEILDKQAEIDQTEIDLEIAQNTEQQEYEAMKDRIQYMYECGEETFLDMIFSSEDLSDLLSKTEYVQSITSYDQKKMQELAATRDSITTMLVKLENDKIALDDEKSELEVQKQELVALETDLENQQVYVDTVLGEKENALQTLSAQKTATAEEKAAAEEELVQQERMVANLQAQWLAAQQAIIDAGGDVNTASQIKLTEIGLSGGFTWPLPGYNTSKDNITSPYGDRIHPIFGTNSFHDGIDISGSGVYGKPIVAAYSGTVTHSGYLAYYDGYGNYVEIDHGSGVSTLYAHMSSMAVSEGDVVNAGDVIGYVGSTGNSTGAHLHFGLYMYSAEKGKIVSVDPALYLPMPSGYFD